MLKTIFKISSHWTANNNDFFQKSDSLFGELQILVFLLTIITACESFMAFGGLMGEGVCQQTCDFWLSNAVGPWVDF